MSNTPELPPSFADTVRWPLIVVGLLLGHATLMVVAMTLANADPPKLVEGSPYAAAPPAQGDGNSTGKADPNQP